MSSPEQPRAPQDDRNLTVIVVPHGDLESRTFSISYTKLKLLVIAGAVLLVVFALSLAALFPVMTQAARVTALERELEQLEAERARVAELARTLQEVEAQYERVRQLLGADAPVGNNPPVLPPLRDTTKAEPPEDEPPSTALIDSGLHQVPGFITRALAAGRSEHPGLDIAVPRNFHIRATGPGTVHAAGIDDVYGRRSTAPHLHFEVRRDGKPVDPFSYVRQH
jgi:murein DD-endopeptidase MepM/ murein hydrolase activator NlpD